MNVNREGKFKISVVKSNKTTLQIVKERTLEETRQYNRTKSILNPLTMSEFYRDRNMHDPHTSTWCRDYSNNNPFNRNYQLNNNFQSCGPAACLIKTQYWPSHTQSDYYYYYYKRPNYYEYGPNHSNFSPPIDSHSFHYNQYQNQPYTNDYSQYQYSEKHNYQNNYYAQNLISSNHCGANDEYPWKSRTLVTISSNVQQQNNKKLSFINELMDKKQIGFNKPNYQKKCSSVQHTQDRKKVDRYPRAEPIYDISPSTKYAPIKCETIDLCEEDRNENYPTTIKITNHIEIVSEEVKRKKNSKTNAPNNQDLYEIKDVSIETNENWATNTIKIKNGTETVSERLKRIDNPLTNAPNNQDLCEIKDVSIETNEKYATNTIKIKNGTETVSEKVRRNDNPETNALHNQDLCEIKDVSIETNEKYATNKIKIKNGTETVSEKVRRNQNSETYAPNDQYLCKIQDISIETNENWATNTIKVKNGTETVSERLKRIDNPETNALHNQDLCEIKDVSFETNENFPKNTIKIINGTESVSEEVKRKKNPETKSPNNQNIFKMKGVSIETQDVCNTQQVCTLNVCSDCKEVFPCNTQQNCEKKIDLTRKIQDTKFLEIGNGLATKNKSYSSATNSIGNHKKTIKSSLLSRNKKSLDPSMLTRKEMMDTSKFLKAPKNNKSDNGSNIYNKDTNNLCKKKSYIDTFYKQKIDASYKIPKLSKYKIEDNSESNVNECNNNVNKISEGKKGVKVIGDVKSTKNILESRENSTYIKVKKSENNKKICIDNLSRDKKTINKSNQLKCNNKANRMSLEKPGVNVNRVVKIPTLLKSTEPKETKDAKEKNIVTNKTKSGDKAISKNNSRLSETTKKRKLTVAENIKDKKKHKVETGKLTSKTKPAIVKTWNEQFNTSKSLVHVSNDLVVEKPNKQNSRHKTSSRNEKLTKTLKEDRESLLITVDKDKKMNVKSNVKDEKHKIKKHTKQKSNLNIIINITYPEKTSKQKCTKETYSVEDLSFLDDFNVDEIVKSLDNC